MTKQILVLGDVMLDTFVYGSVTRISPEAATPILNAEREDSMIGGAGNVARNVVSLGERCTLITVMGEDATAGHIARLCDSGYIHLKSLRTHTRETTQKTRFVCDEHSSHLLRLDRESTHQLAFPVEAELIDLVVKTIPHADCVVLADYGKGCLTPRLIRRVIEECTPRNIPILVDSKRDNPNIFAGVTLVKPNYRDLVKGRPVSEDEFIMIAQTYGGYAKADVLITRGEKGMTLYRTNGDVAHVPAHKVRVRDVSGAGDTVMASLAISYANRLDTLAAVKLASDAAAIAVSKPGTAAVFKSELAAGYSWGKVSPDYQINGLSGHMVRDWRAQKLRIGFTNGCFDLLHPGHVKLLREARADCDRLIVGLNSNASVRALKGPTRPIQTWVDRAAVLAAVEGVDLVVGFTQCTPINLIRNIEPDVIYKGSDYAAGDVVGRGVAEVKIIQVSEHSTTKIVEGVQDGIRTLP